MRFAITSAVFLAAIAAACEPAPQPQPDEMDSVVNATRTDVAVPEGAAGNESDNAGQGNAAPSDAEQQARSPATVVERFANFVVERRFDEARQLWDPAAASFSADQLAEKFSRFETMRAALDTIGENAGGSVQEDVQLTISGTRKDGSNYTVTGPVTVQRVDDRQWSIVKVVLTSNAAAADSLVGQQ